jgi:hypothetical protein
LDVTERDGEITCVEADGAMVELFFKKIRFSEVLRYNSERYTKLGAAFRQIFENLENLDAVKSGIEIFRKAFSLNLPTEEERFADSGFAPIDFTDDATPYIHALQHHLLPQMEKLKKWNIHINDINMESVEKYHSILKKCFFDRTTHDAEEYLSKQILTVENRKLFYRYKYRFTSKTKEQKKISTRSINDK